MDGRARNAYKKEFSYKNCREEFYFSILFTNNDLAYLLMTNSTIMFIAIIVHVYGQNHGFSQILRNTSCQDFYFNEIVKVGINVV